MTQGGYGGEQSIEVAVLRSLDYFGEVAIILKRPAVATVTAQGILKCLKIEKSR